MLNKAIKIAYINQREKYFLCAIITDKKGNILSVGKNDYYRSHPTQAYYAERCGNGQRIFIHAEIDALTKIPYGKKPFSIYIARTSKNGTPLLAKPCPICSEAIKDSGIKEENIYYTKGENGGFTKI
jgi:tRNA(Arg) A34 adenosine deaminase TadA